MATLKERHIVDENGQRVAVILDIADSLTLTLSRWERETRPRPLWGR